MRSVDTKRGLHLDESLVEAYSGQTNYKVKLDGTLRRLPVVPISDHIWIASDAELVLGDVEFLGTAARLLARKVKRRRVDVILTAEAKSIALAYELAKLLGHPRFIVARKSLKAYMGDYVAHKLKSITTKNDQELVLTREEAESLSGRRVCLLDDVVSTGGTLKALEALVAGAGGKVACRAAVWKEGPWYKSDLIYVSALPIFVDDIRDKSLYL